MADTPTTIHADSDPKYYLRFLFMGVVLVGFALWSLYDGLVAYPAQRERALVYEQMRDEGRAGEWAAYAEQQGWPPGLPGEPKTDADIKVQFIQAAVVTLIAVPLLLIPIRSRGRWIQADDRGISTSWGERIDFDRVVALDKKKWHKKGIAKVRYQDAGGRNRTFILDDYKFRRDPTDLILYQLESQIGPEKITGGPPEPPLEHYAEEPAEQPNA